MASSKDFIANQIRIAKVITTGSQSGDGGIGVRNISLAVYDESITLNNEGGVTDSNIYASAGTDVTVMISGSRNSRGTNATSGGGVVLMGGDMYVSGALVVENAGRTYGSISGSIHKTSAGLDYLLGTGGIAISSASNGQVTIDGSGISGGGDASLNYYDESNAANPFSPSAAGNQSVVIGTNTLASAGSEYTLVFGLNNTGSDTEMSNIAGGYDNKILNVDGNSGYSRAVTISGGRQNIVSGSSSYSNIAGGYLNKITGSTNADDDAGFNTIGGGTSNKISGSYNVIGGGQENKIENPANGKFFIGGGFQNTSNSEQGVIAGGSVNTVGVWSDFSFIGAGGSNKSEGNSANDNTHYAVIAGGQSNKISATAGGSGGSPNSAILGGWLNKIQNSENSSILGGKNNLINAHDSSMLLGQHLTSSAANQTILGYGSTFGGTGYVVASGSFLKSDGLNGGAITGSLTRTKDGLSYLVAGTNVTIATSSMGQVTINAASGGSSEWTDASGVLHPADASGAQTVVIGGTAPANSDIILGLDGGATFNETGASVDFRVESNTLPGAILVDGGDDTIVLGASSTTFANLRPGMNGSDVIVALTGSANHKGNSAAAGRGTILAAGDLVSSGTFYADSIDAGERHTYACQGARTIMSGSDFVFFSSTFIDGEIVPSNGIEHVQLGKINNNNVQGYALMTTIPSGSKKLQVTLTAKTNFTSGGGGDRIQVHVSGAHYTTGTPGPLFLPQEFVLNDDVQVGTLNNAYQKIAGTLDLSTLGFDVTANPDMPIVLGIFRKDLSGESAASVLQVLSTELQFKM